MDVVEDMDRTLTQDDFDGIKYCSESCLDYSGFIDGFSDGYHSGNSYGFGFGSGSGCTYDSDSNCDVGSGSGYGGGYGSDFVNGFGYSFGPGDCQGKSSGYDRIKFREFWFYNKNPIIR